MEKETGSTARDMEKESGKRDYGQRIKTMGRAQAASATKDRIAWKERTCCPIPHLGDKLIMMMKNSHFLNKASIAFCN